MKVFNFFLIITIFCFHSCSETNNINYKEQLSDPELFQAAMQNLTDIVVYDIFSPPVASRVYLYPSVAAYEIMAYFNSDNFNSLKGQVKNYKTFQYQKIQISTPILLLFFLSIKSEKH